MKQNYNSFKFWETAINENKTIRGHMFMETPPKEKSLYIHTLIFSKKNGIDNIYAYFPDAKVLLGYLQHSFLQEAFYKWIYGKNSVVTKIPSLPVDKIISDGYKKGRISKETANSMNTYYNKLNKMWDLPKDRIVGELIKFAREFNKTWFGDNTEFLYIKIFKTPKEVGEFVVNATLVTTSVENFKRKIGVDIDEWKKICEKANKDEAFGEKFRKIIRKNLSEIL
ncbi:hypothetical protein ACTNDG_02040 [Clostridium sp. HCP1S3_B4]|uniref:hypothetical protein n=1 Tax=unclassified Clostridium TaxID=2614128 RepID=UPI0016932DC5|nr:hypothetical protein [Clostridiales bacterium]MDY2728534.1 hypothetical protein [Clostridium sp.]NLK23712.1 hypothetical protein [Clostridiales bacterium]